MYYSVRTQCALSPKFAYFVFAGKAGYNARDFLLKVTIFVSDTSDYFNVFVWTEPWRINQPNLYSKKKRKAATLMIRVNRALASTDF